MKALISSFIWRKRCLLCEANDMGVYYAEYNTVSAPIFNQLHLTGPICTPTQLRVIISLLDIISLQILKALPYKPVLCVQALCSAGTVRLFSHVQQRWGRKLLKGEKKHNLNSKQEPFLQGNTKDCSWKRHYLALIMQLWKTSGGWGNSFW